MPRSKVQDRIPIEPCARWTPDCQGKQDYDGRLLSISTRAWPPHYSPGRQWTAHAAIVINHGEPNEAGYADYTVWRERDFSAPTEAALKFAVEEWVQEQMIEVLARLRVQW
jgi:hypothetical protein